MSDAAIMRAIEELQRRLDVLWTGDEPGIPEVYNVMTMYGAKGDDSTDDWEAIKDALIDAYNDGGGIVYLPPRTYYTTDILPLCGNVTLWGPGATIRNDGSGTTNWIWSNLWNHYSQQKNRVLSAIPYGFSSTTYDIDTPTQFDDEVTTSTAADAGNFSEGDYVFLEWGTCESDSNEEWYAGVNRVRVDGDTGTGVIGLEAPIPADATYTTLPDTVSGPRIRKITGPWTGSIVGPITFYSDTDGTSAADNAVVIDMSYGGSVYDARFSEGRAAIAVVDSYGVILDGIYRDRHPRRDGETSVVKALVGGWGNSNIIVTNFRDHTWGRSDSVGFETTTWGATIGPGIVIHHQPDATEQSAAIGLPVNEGGVQDVLIHDVVIRNAYDGIQGPDNDSLHIRDCVITVSNEPLTGNLYPRHVAGCSYEIISTTEMVHQTCREKFWWSGTVTSGGGPVHMTADNALANNNANAGEYLFQRAGKLIGLHILTDAAITSGTVTVRMNVNGTIQATLVNLDSTNTPDFSHQYAYTTTPSSLTFSAGDTVGVEIVGTSFAPTPMDVWIEFEIEY